MNGGRANQIELFYSYSHKDERLRNQLETHLSLLKRRGVLSSWHDRKISAGSEWQGQIDAHLNSADVILLLVSSDFLSSHYCYDLEVKRAMERHDAGEARVIPVILRPVDWHAAPFGKLLALPTDGKPVTRWGNRDQAWLDVAQGIRAAVDPLQSRASVNTGAAVEERVHVHPADEQDRDSGLDLLVGADQEFPRIEQLWADGAYQGGFEDWVETTLGWRVTIVSAPPAQVGFAVQPRRWVVERTFAHLGRYRRLAKDFEHMVECAVAHILTASIHIMLKRLVATS